MASLDDEVAARETATSWVQPGAREAPPTSHKVVGEKRDALFPAVGHGALLAPVTFVTGKGGVGKSTMAAAIALAAARSGRRTALVEFDDGEAGQRALAGADAPVDHRVIPYNIALEQTITPLLGSALLARSLVRHGPVHRLTRAMPAMREFVSLEAVRALVSSSTYDHVVVDLPASGHAVDWLRVPGAFERFLLGGPLGTLGRRVREEVIAPGRSDVVIVTLAEPLVVQETHELAQKLKAELQRNPAVVILNRAHGPLQPGALEASRRWQEQGANPHVPLLVRWLEGRDHAAHETQRAWTTAHQFEARSVRWVPETPTDPKVTEVLTWLEAPPS